MPGRDRKLDPISHDYIDDGAGGWETTTTLETALQHQILDRLDAWVGDPDAGSELYKFQRARNSEMEARRAAEAVRRASKPLVDAGLAADPKVTVTRNTHGRWKLTGSLVDVQHGEIDLTPLLPFGG